MPQGIGFQPRNSMETSCLKNTRLGAALPYKTSDVYLTQPKDPEVRVETIYFPLNTYSPICKSLKVRYEISKQFVSCKPANHSPWDW